MLTFMQTDFTEEQSLKCYLKIHSNTKKKKIIMPKRHVLKHQCKYFIGRRNFKFIEKYFPIIQVLL